jgi:site-specific DNA-adenine methylase
MSIRDTLNDVTNRVVEKFNEHPKKFGLTYREHFLTSIYYGACSMVCTIVFVFHAIFPFLFKTTGGHIVAHILDKIHSVKCNTSEINTESDGHQKASSIDAIEDLDGNEENSVDDDPEDDDEPEDDEQECNSSEVCEDNSPNNNGEYCEQVYDDSPDNEEKSETF